jgi:hypothetical protein
VSLGFAGRAGSDGETEALHFADVLSFAEEYREDVDLCRIEEKFREALT